MSLEVYQIIWYVVIGLSIVCYVMLDGFDLGVGCVHLLAKSDEDRRIFLNSIGPVWDGNAVWIVIVGGASFAGFPDVYATIFSGFYMLTMILLCGFIFRAVAIEFRSKHDSHRWRRFWDVLFSLASIIIAFGIGVVLGNLVKGIPLDAEKNFTGTFMSLITPYSILIGLFSVALLSMHGSIYLAMKTHGDLHDRVRRWITPSIIFFLVFYFFATISSFAYVSHMIERMERYPILFIVPLITLVVILSIPYQIYKKRDGWAFISSCLAIAMLFSLFGIGTFPHIVRSTVDPEHLSLTVFNASSSIKTLKVLVTIAVIGVPLVLGYGYYIYRIFRGKTRLDSTSY